MFKLRSYSYFILLAFLFISSYQINSQWTQLHEAGNGYYGFYINIDFVDVNTGYALNLDSAVTKTTNGGLNWVRMNGTSGYGLFQIQFPSSSTGYAIGNVGFSNGKFLRTTNNGENWTALSMPYYIFSMDFVNDNTGYLTDDNGFVHKTINGGLSWISINLPVAYLTFVDFLDFNTGFVVASSNQRLFVTTNGGLNWQEKYSPNFFKIQFIDFNIGFGFDIVQPGRSIIYKTTNNGSSWSNLFQQDSLYLVDINFINENTGWISGGKLFNNIVFYRKLYKTTDSGFNWIEQYTGNVSVDSSSCLGVIQMLDSSNGYVSTAHCEVVGTPTIKGRLYKTTNGGGSPIGIEPVYSNIPENYILHQNYPNPFNPVTKISFEIPANNSSGIAKLSIYDVTGREVFVLLNEHLLPGKYQIDWKAENFTSGVYFYTLSTGNFKVTKKMLLIK
jgi:photosystem II stability/assembly factor-like uncharacterized protein